MREFFVVANSNAAPFASDTSTFFVTAMTAEQAAAQAVLKYNHPCGLYALSVYESADAYHKDEKPLIQHLSPRADMRINGVTCKDCGHKTHAVVLNKGGTVDVHHCSRCDKDIEVDMSKVA